MQRTRVTIDPQKRRQPDDIQWYATTVENQVTQQGGVPTMSQQVLFECESKVKVKEGMYCEGTVEGC